MKVDTPDSASTISMTNTITITVEQDGIYEINGARQEPVVNLNMVTGASKLRKQLRETNELLVCPGVYDGLSARIAINLGFKGMYMVCWIPHTTFPHSQHFSASAMEKKDHTNGRVRPAPVLPRLDWAWPIWV